MNQVEDSHRVKIRGTPEDTTFPSKMQQRYVLLPKIPCIVEDCKNTSVTLMENRRIRMFEPPASPIRRQPWIDAIPQLASTSNGKVCEIHFLNCSPTFENPYPILFLNRKRKLSSPAIPQKKYVSVTKVPGSLSMNQQPGVFSPMVPNVGGKTNHTVSPMTTRKIIRVIHKNPINESKIVTDELGSSNSHATATITASKPLTLSDIIGEMSKNQQNQLDQLNQHILPSQPSQSTQPIKKTVASVKPSAQSIQKLMTSAISSTQQSQKLVSNSNPPSHSIQKFLSPAIPSTSTSISNTEIRDKDSLNKCPTGSHDHLVTDSACSKCISQLPTIRKSLGRLEARLDTMLNMAKTLLKRANQSGPGQVMQPVQKKFSSPFYNLSDMSKRIPSSVPNSMVNNIKVYKKTVDLPGSTVLPKITKSTFISMKPKSSTSAEPCPTVSRE